MRITRTAVGIVVDGPSSGRGAWLCRSVAPGPLVSAECFEQAIARGAFERTWRGSVGSDEQRTIKEHIGQEADEDSERDGH